MTTILWNPLEELFKESGAKHIMFGYGITPQVAAKFAELCNNDFFKKSLNQAISNANTATNAMVKVECPLFTRDKDTTFNKHLDEFTTKILDCIKEHRGNEFCLYAHPMADIDMIEFLKQYKAESPNDFKNVILNTSFFDDYNRTLDTGKEIYITLPFNELLTEINKGTIKDDENLYNYYLKHFDKQNPQQKLGDFKDFEKDLLAINKQITYYESKKSVLLAEAKQRIPKEILAKLDKLSEKNKQKYNYKPTNRNLFDTKPPNRAKYTQISAKLSNPAPTPKIKDKQ